MILQDREEAPIPVVRRPLLSDKEEAPIPLRRPLLQDKEEAPIPMKRPILQDREEAPIPVARMTGGSSMMNSMNMGRPPLPGSSALPPAVSSSKGGQVTAILH